MHSHRIFLRAAKIFAGLEKKKNLKRGEKAKKDDEESIDFESPQEKKLTFELAFVVEGSVAYLSIMFPLLARERPLVATTDKEMGVANSPDDSCSF